MAALIPITRKRSRSYEEEDFLPLSKKINNLHINQWQSFEKVRHAIDEAPNQWENKFTTPQSHPQETWPVQCAVGESVPKSQPQDPWPPSYAPELTAEENPFYFESNRLLFELYLSRVHRTTY